jgi:hypothetical protein
MALVTQVIPSFNGGVSQQPDRSRFINQLSEQVNGLSNDVEGLQKRPPSVYLSYINEYASTCSDAKFHFINRDSNEKYIMMLKKNSTNIVIRGVDGVTAGTAYSSFSYLNTSNPKEDIRCVTIADYTLILNKKIKPAMKSSLSVTTNDGWALIYCKGANYGKSYGIWINGSFIAGVKMPDGSTTQDARLTTAYRVAKTLYDLLSDSNISAGYYSNWYQIADQEVTGDCKTLQRARSTTSMSNYTYQMLGDSVIAIRYSDGRATPPNVTVKDGAGNTNMYVLRGSTTSTSKLPPEAPNGCVIKVQSEKGSDDSVYYLKYDSTLGNWVETLKGGIKYAIDPSTMPHALVRNSDGSFTVKQMSWTDRKVGDETTNSEPSFIGKQVNDIFFFRNRLGFVADENVILSVSSDFFNFWFNSSATVVDTDPIDVSLSSNKVAVITDVIPFNKELFLFSHEGQFVLHSQGAMSPATVAIDQVTAFRYSKSAKPITLGQSLFYITEHTASSSLMRYYMSQDISEAMDSEDVTAHCPEYMPTGISFMTGSTSENIVVMGTGTDANLYVFKYLMNDSKVIQQSVSKWTLGTPVQTIRHAEFVDSNLYVWIDRGYFITLEKISFTSNRLDFSDEPYRVLMDGKREVTKDVTYDKFLDKSTITLPVTILKDETVCIFSVSDGKYTTYTPTRSLDSFIVDGDWSNKKLYYGFPYTFDVTLSKCFIKTANESGIDVVDNGKVQVRSFKLNYSHTGCFNVTVRNTAKGKEYTYVSTNKQLGTTSSKTDVITVTDGTFKFPVQDCNTNVEIEIVSDTPQPITLVSGSFDALYVPRTRRM